MNTPRLQIRSLYKSFGDRKVLQGFDLDVAAGESIVVLGGSGSGKSVLLKCLLGLTLPESGSVLIDGAPSSIRGGGGRIGMLFQSAALFDSLSVWENVAFPLFHGRGGRNDRRRGRALALETLERVGLSADAADLSPSALSGGMRKRVGLARAIAARPDILLFDEPTTGLDPITARMIDGLIRRCVSETNATAITISHDMDSVRRIGQRVVLLYRGRNIWTGPVAALDSTDDPYVRQFVNGLPDGPMTAATPF